jgi:prophage antirepressor-like protein
MNNKVSVDVKNNYNVQTPLSNVLASVFSYNDNHTVRTLMIDNEPWFVAKDVCDILEISKYRDALSRLDDDERGSVLVDTPGGKQEMGAVNESGLYSIIMKSRKPEAKVFKKWITHEVIPSIRKSGKYDVVNTIQDSYMIQNPVERAKAWIVEQEKLQLAELQVKELEIVVVKKDEVILEKDEMIQELEPDAIYARDMLIGNGLSLATDIAKIYGMSSHKFNKLLNTLNVQYKLKGSNHWLLYSKYDGLGYTHLKSTRIETKYDSKTSYTMMWTEKGKRFLYDLLSELNIYPDIVSVK